MKRVLVTGSRKYTDAVRLDSILADLRHSLGGFACLIHGGATGADTLAAEWAERNGVVAKPYPVSREEWNRVGPAAGPLRNRRMLVEGRPDVVVAFPGHRGTADMCKQAEAAGVLVVHVE
jgi:hypothetical protein